MTTASVNPRRADTRRNHESILNAATESLTSSERISFNRIAKQAGVGVGTVYRHFPTAESLTLAVYQRDLEQLGNAVPDLLDRHDPEQAFRIWVTDHLAHHMMTRPGLAKALTAASCSPTEHPFKAHEILGNAVTALLRANSETGNIRTDLNPIPVLHVLGGLLCMTPEDDWRTETTELIDLLWRGMSAVPHSSGSTDMNPSNDDHPRS